jgi:hypothetical protein
MSLCRWVCKTLCGVPYEDKLVVQPPIALREASHRLNNEIMAFQNAGRKVQVAADELSDIVEHMNGHSP